MRKNNTIPQINDIKDVKKFFSSSLKNIFSSNVNPQSIYSSGSIINVIRNSISSKQYIEHMSGTVTVIIFHLQIQYSGGLRMLHRNQGHIDAVVLKI